MMNKWIQAWVNPGGLLSQVDLSRRMLLYVINGIMIAVALMLVMALATQTDGETIADPLRTIGVLIVTCLFLLVSSWLAHSGRVEVSGFITGFVVAFAVGSSTINNGLNSFSDGISLAMVLILFALLNGRTGIVVGLVISLAEVVYSFSFVPADSTQGLLQYVAPVLMILAISGATYAFWRFAVLNRAEGAASAEAERLKLATLTSQIAQRISRRNALSVVLEETVEQIRTQYPTVYHAQIFLMDEMGMDAKLAASTGEVGKLLLARKHSLPVGSQSVIGRVTGNNAPVIARAGSADHKRNELLPETEQAGGKF
jgi:hypothetical protein